MNNRVLLKEIPTGIFHSAIFTTFSINLYYLEQQVLPLLGSKGVHYISILADSDMLSSQLENFSSFSQHRKRNYAIHGIKSRGAFHPKIIFLAGEESILLLIGSGNLTTSGHGKNLEIWNAIYVKNIEDNKYGFIIQAWNYIKHLHNDLGNSANNKIKSIEKNCTLLSAKKEVLSTIFELDANNQISFHANRENNTLFNQVSDIISNDQINRITIMCPFHDSAGEFIKELNSRYKPKQIDVIIQSDFGTLPHKMKQQSNVSFFDWKDVIGDKHSQAYFHAKNIVFEGENRNYLISGSANASIAAFGTSKIPARNQESCVIYQSSKIDYLNLLSIKTEQKSVNLSEYEFKNDNNTLDSSKSSKTVFIKSAEKSYDKVSLLLQVNEHVKDVIIQLFDSNNRIRVEELISLDPREYTIEVSLPYGISLLFAQISLQDKVVISNKQFIIDTNAFENTNPSPSNRSLNQIRKQIEGGDFSTLKIIDYLNTIYRQKKVKKGISIISEQKEQKNELPLELDNNLVYLSYAEIQERVKQINNLEQPHHYVEYKGVRLWESIFSYLKENREKELQSKIDEEEMEDINKSSGRKEEKSPKVKRTISESNYKKLKEKISKFLYSYYNILLAKTNDSKSEQPSIIDLSMYLIMLEILLHLIGHREIIDKENEKKHLLELQLLRDGDSWSDFLIQYIGLFTMWCTQKSGFIEFDNADYNDKLRHYKLMAFKTTLSTLSVYSSINKNYDKSLQQQWLMLSLLNSNRVFNCSNTTLVDTQEFISFIPQNVLDEIGEVSIEDEITSNITLLNEFIIKEKTDIYIEGDYYCHSEIGYTYIEKIITSSNNQFYKLFATGFEWNANIENYWNGCVFSTYDNRWIKSMKGSR